MKRPGNNLQVVSYSIYHSANCYLGSILAERALEHLAVEIVRRPLSVPKDRGVLVADLVGGRESAARGSYNREDCSRWARRHGIELHYTPPDVFAARAEIWKRSPLAREELPARAYYGAIGSGKETDLDRALFRLTYVEGLDVNDEDVVRRAALEAGLDADETLERAGAAETRAALERAAADFERDACPGLPTWVVAGERFWGKDRVDWLSERVRQLGA